MHPAAQSRIRENNAAHEPEAGWETDAKSDDKCADMRADGHKTKLNHLLFKDIIVAHKVQHNIKQGIASAACQVTKCLKVNELPEWRVKLVYNGYDEILGHF